MLKISTKTRYALRALLEMACRQDCNIFKLKELAKNQGISRKYLENIFTRLKKKRIIRSRIGKNGGFYFDDQSGSVSLLQIIEALEGPLDIVACRKRATECSRALFCPAKGIWQEINASLSGLLASKKLKDLAGNKDIRAKCFQSIAPAKK